ncbi:MAG: hypothetical protein PHE55_16435 [Methylococcaceae bacterium]|nr:hypothetical protein [Methylococcaceae bacterium]
MKPIPLMPLGLLLTLAIPQSALAARNFPTDTEVENIVKTCAAGYSTSIQGEVSGALKLWRKQGEISGNGGVTELGGIIAALKNDDAKVAVFKIYSDCIKTTLPQYMGDGHQPSSEYKASGDRPSAPAVSASGGGIAAGGNVSATTGSGGTAVVNTGTVTVGQPKE